MCEEHKVCAPRHGSVRSSQCQKAEFHSAINGWEKTLAILEVIQADERPLGHQITEIILGRIVGCDAGRKDTADPSPSSHDGTNAFGEYGIRVDPAATTKRVCTG